MRSIIRSNKEIRNRIKLGFYSKLQSHSKNGSTRITYKATKLTSVRSLYMESFIIVSA